MLKLLNTIKQANVESITNRYQRILREAEHKCYSCGRDYKRDEIEERVIRYQGEPEVILVCPRCISLGFDDWNIG